jgi:putative OPT family oligopeptide transporter
MSSAYMIWHRTSSTIIGTGMGFDISMIGAGYIIGFSVGVSMILGACVGWIFGIPILAFHLPGFTGTTDINDYVMGIWTSKIRYLGIGTMLVGGLWSLVVSMKPIIASLKSSYQATRGVSFSSQTTLPRTERDIPLSYTLLSIAVLLVLLGFYIFHELARMDLSLSIGANLTFIISTVLYLLIGGFVFSAIAAYFSGLVGMSASPVSAINIAILILISLLLSAILNVGALRHDTPALILHAAAISIIITAVLACAACMCNGTIQDLKTGEILGATPWKLQTSLIIGVALSTLVVPPVVELLFNAYGMGGVFPRPDMDKSQVLGAPQASLIAAVAQGMFLHNMPMHLILIGVVIGIVMILFNAWLSRVYNQKLSLVAFAIGIYLPMAMTFPIFVGSLVSLFINRHIKKVHGSANTKEQIAEGAHSTTLIACGLVAGGAIMGLLISIPFALEGNTQALSLVPASFAGIAAIISIITTFLVCYWMYRTGIRAARG